MVWRSLLAPAALLLALSGVSSATAGEKESLAIEHLLKVGWGTTTSFRIAGDAQAEKMFEAAGRDPSALYALALMHIKQRRYAEATRLVDELLATDETSLPIWRAKVWLLTAQKNYDAAMIAAEKLAQLVAKEDVKTADEDAHALMYVAFLGRIYGFLGGPAQANVNLDARKLAEKKLVDSLADSRRLAFEEARDGVLKKFVEFTDATQDHKDKAKEQADADREKTLKEVAALRDENKERVKELEAKVAKHKEEYQKESSAITKADTPLQRELARINGEATVVQQQLIGVGLQIASLQTQINAERDPNVRNFLFADLNRLGILEANIQADLARLDARAVAVQNQRAVLADRHLRAEVDLAKKMALVDEELGSIGKKERRADIAEKKAVKAVAGTPQGALSLSAIAAALATYEPFPLEQEKSRLLEVLRR